MTDESNYLQLAYVRGDWSCTVRSEAVAGVQAFLDEAFGDGTFAAVTTGLKNQIGSGALDGAVNDLHRNGLGTTPTQPADDNTPPFVPTGNAPISFGGNSGGGGAPKAAGPKTLGWHEGFEVVLWSTGQYGPNVLLKGSSGPDGKPLRQGLAKGENPDGITLDRALQLLASRQQYLQSKQG